MKSLFDPEEMERHWQGALSLLRAEGVDTDAMTERIGRMLPDSLEEMERRRNTPWTDAERAEVVRFVMDGPL